MRVGPVEVSAAHFIQTATDESKCQRLHGHNYNIMVDIYGKINRRTHMIIDATEVKSEINKLDHRTLVPRRICSGEVVRKGKEYIIFENPRTKNEYTIPKSDIVLLDVPAISAEYLAEHLAEHILSLTQNIERVVVFVAETSKMTATVEAERPKENKEKPVCDFLGYNIHTSNTVEKGNPNIITNLKR